MPNTREKLIELLLGRKEVVSEVCENTRCKTCQYEKYGFNCDKAILADHLIANGVTVWENLVAKQVVIDKKYGSTRCPSCNAVLGASSHYCWQCGQKVTHKLPQPPKGE